MSSLAMVAATFAAACSPSGPRDVATESRDVRRTTEAVAPEAYVYVTRRPHGVVALAEARHMTDAEARAIVERIADDLERCLTALELEGTLVSGAARVVAIAGPNGVPALNVRLAPGEAVAHNALLCLVAPVRATTFPATTRDAPGLAIETTWGPAAPRALTTPTREGSTDAGGSL